MSPNPKPAKCSRCDDGGLVMLDRVVDDVTAPGGRRRSADAYRCECAAGARMAKRFPLAPPAGHLQLLPTRRDLDG
jgi:hypothetical protein